MLASDCDWIDAKLRAATSYEFGGRISSGEAGAKGALTFFPVAFTTLEWMTGACLNHHV